MELANRRRTPQPSSPLHVLPVEARILEPAGFQPTADGIPTYWVARERLKPTLKSLKSAADGRFGMLLDLACIDERERGHRDGQPRSAFTLVYHLLSLEKSADVRVKVALPSDQATIPSIVDLWPSANWYEREAWDMFGIRFEGHPNLRRILMPSTWVGHPLRKEHPARATEMTPFALPEDLAATEDEALRFKPDEWGLAESQGGSYMYLNVGPQHPGTHGVLRIVLHLDGEVILDAVPDIGFHHRGAEKMAERQSWHTYIPYTDRVDYLGGVLNNLAYLLPLEKLCGIEVPDRAKLIRIMLCELFRIASHLVWYGTFAQDVGAFSPVFYMFNDRERVFRIVEAITGGRMHPAWFRIGGVAQDLPKGWTPLVRDFLRSMPARLAEYDKMVLGNAIFKRRTQGVGTYTMAQAMEWGVTGPGLRACNCGWDVRKARPYSGYDALDFEVPTATTGDCYGRALVRVEEIRQSLRIVEQCVEHLGPGGAQESGPYKAKHPLAVPPLKGRTMHDIETLISHFLGVSWGPVVPPGEAFVPIEAAKGLNGYLLVSDGGTSAYRARIRTPSFPHLQMLPLLCRGAMISDLVAILGSIDYVLSDVDR